MVSADERYMARALDLARQGHGTTWPNPMVGALVVRDGDVLCEGYHRVAGGPHAEVDALSRATGSVAGGTLYVNLEPCCHRARTGPCTAAVVESGVARVVVGTCDPNPEVAGCGVTALREAGIEVVQGVLARECTDLNEVYFVSRARQRPHITLKAATDLFGRTATRTGESQWITGEESRAHAHTVRSVAQAIAVGSATALADDPRLTARGESQRPPTRVLFDSQLRVPPTAKIYADDGVPVIVYTTQRGLDHPVAARPTARASVVPCGAGPRVDLGAAVADLTQREVVSLLVEGGATLAGAFLDAGLFDRVLRYMAPLAIGGDEAPGPVRGRGVAELAAAPSLEFVQQLLLGPDVLLVARRPLEVPCSPD